MSNTVTLLIDILTTEPFKLLKQKKDKKVLEEQFLLTFGTWC